MNIPISESSNTKRDYLCGICWAELLITHSKHDRLSVEVNCSQFPEHEGIIRRDYVRRLQAQDAAQAREAQRNIGHLLGLDKPARSAEQVSKRLFPCEEE